MNKFAPIALLATVATLAIPSVVFAAEGGEASQTVRAATAEAATVEVNAGKMLYGGNGNRIASVYRVDANGNPQLILDGHIVTVPASSLSIVNGKVTTTLTKRELLKTR